MAGLTVAAAVGGGGGFAATYGTSHSTNVPASKTPSRDPASDVHYACHHHGTQPAQV